MSWWNVFRVSKNIDDRRRGTVRTLLVSGIAAGAAAWAAFLVKPAPPPPDVAADMVAHVVGDLEDIWKAPDLLGLRFRPATVTLYVRSTTTKGCGRAQSAEGPFYCPIDEHIYLDLSFWSELTIKQCKTKMTSEACEFARAYVVAHEYGHHIQQILGTFDRVGEDQRTGPNSAGVRLELGADCFAGLWAGRSQTKWKNTSPADISAAWAATQWGGDDHFGVPPSEYTHGTGAQRGRWLLRGYDKKTIEACDTFAAGAL